MPAPRVTTPWRKEQRRGARFDRALYRARNVVERLINRLKQFRRIATRHETLAESYRAMLVPSAICPLFFELAPSRLAW